MDRQTVTYLTPRAYAKLIGVGARTVHDWLTAGRLANVVPIYDNDGKVVAWGVPSNAEPPVLKSGPRPKS